ncbi:polyphosphate:nucleotide phosphotransferase, PPK2 family [Aeromicrobium marinum DSM 15272]|uniref:Polyphosphate:nucleotide phosphotransferase, PPK2 family n=2 Tax=Aeromicrobium marinum TaxID=219314 RepID=E2S9A8_9ACTN|nr:polyphosphate:nucleotide phosphotransferase, PPK2 family [Aeromicrobium marinum DSM 15272]
MIAMASSVTDLLRTTGPVDLAAIDARSTPGFDDDKDAALAATAQLEPELADLQERLFAGGRAGTTERRVLLLLQGMDTAGKGGTLRKVAGLMDPQGLTVTAFKKPTDEELQHDFLWRIGPRLPQPGMVGVFDRSHYEDVLIGRVRQLADDVEIERRYGAINEFEQQFVDSGGVIVKCFLHVDAETQAERLAERLEDPTKHWKYNPGDLDERALWAEYQQAYEIALERCSTDAAPWHVVPAGRKWYRNWAVGVMLLDALRGLDLQWPPADFDVAAEQARLAASR